MYSKLNQLSKCKWLDEKQKSNILYALSVMQEKSVLFSDLVANVFLDSKSMETEQSITRSLQVPQNRRKFSLAVGRCLIDPSSFSLNEKNNNNISRKSNSNISNLITPVLPPEELLDSRPCCFDSTNDSRAVNEAFQVQINLNLN